MVEFRTYEDVGQWVRTHGIDALRDLLQCEQMRSNSQSLAAIWLGRHERLDPSPGRRPDGRRPQLPAAAAVK